MVGNLSDIEVVENDVERLILLRKRLNKSQYQFAMDIGISASYLTQIENYKFPFTNQLKNRINNFLKMKEELNEADLFSNFK
ncbi:helix-turn-helix domain-containing protein [Metabacillus halosaccharovorans]|uniref:helix-turn-helix domain-containing protein n=1 Tax=Metabacillus halosaccharovorans TaxID=930124 RepID=UPI000C806DF8|nr:helix-turn-helix transcriptional regulator [Metabacillus halosaccharovorans]MBU7595914.1 helix-turn-helix transcriptional regulator [Metabacillus halosaccharovorans]PMC36236.1 XRE family transcriptional regulator [Bacillus sp. UMB0899]